MVRPWWEKRLLGNQCSLRYEGERRVKKNTTKKRGNIVKDKWSKVARNRLGTCVLLGVNTCRIIERNVKRGTRSLINNHKWMG